MVTVSIFPVKSIQIKSWCGILENIGKGDSISNLICTHAVVGSDHHSTILMNVNMGESPFRPNFSYDYNLEVIRAEHWVVLLQTARSES